MVLRQVLPGALAALLLALSTGASAAPAYVTKNAHLRAGPGRSYPVVAILSQGLQVEVAGCLQDYSWCDVQAAGERGWVYAGNLTTVYDGAQVPLPPYGAAIGIGIVAFVLVDYWHDYYIDRPWYHDRDHWVHHPHPHPHPPRPPHPPYPPPPPRTHVPPPRPVPGGQPRAVVPHPPPSHEPAPPRPPGAGVHGQPAPAPQAPGQGGGRPHDPDGSHH